MSQFDFGNLESPLSGTDLINNNLEPWRDALHSGHMGPTRPSYAVQGLHWIDNSSTPWILKVFTGSDDTSLGTIDPATNIYTPAGVSQAAADISYDNTDSGLSSDNVQDAIDEAYGDYDAFANRVSGFATALQGALAETAVQPAGVAFSKSFVSPEQTITAGGTVSITHGLGEAPKLIQAELICKTAEHGYAVGDRVVINPAINPANASGSQYGHSLILNSTSIVVRYGTGGSGISYVITNALTGAGAGLLNANWRLVVRAYA